MPAVCVKKLLNIVDNPEEEEIEASCYCFLLLLQVDIHSRRRLVSIWVFFFRMKRIMKIPNVAPRIQSNRWVTGLMRVSLTLYRIAFARAPWTQVAHKVVVSTTGTIAQIHENVIIFICVDISVVFKLTEYKYRQRKRKPLKRRSLINGRSACLKVVRLLPRADLVLLSSHGQILNPFRSRSPTSLCACGSDITCHRIGQ